MKHDSRFEMARRTTRSYIAALLVGAGLFGLSACGTTKVITADKSIVYQNSVYNASNIQMFTYVSEAVISPTETIALTNVDKNQFNAILKSHNPLTVRQVVKLDDREMVYQTKSVDSWSDFQDMVDHFQSAHEKITKFLADKNSTQLKLK